MTSRHRRPSPGDAIRSAAEEIRHVAGRTSLGASLAAFSARGLVSFHLGEDAEELLVELEETFLGAAFVSGDREDRQLAERIGALVDDPGAVPEVTLDLRGTPFQKSVWAAVRRIPLGTTVTYADIAREISAPKAMRAVGSACARCPVSLIIPCHRVLRADGTFRGGDFWTPERHGRLIAREAASIANPA